MKNSKIYLMGAIIMLSISLNAQKSVEKTLISSINLLNIKQLTLYFESNLEVQEWDKEVATIIIEVVTNAPNESVMNTLITNGRYQIQPTLFGTNQMILTAPNLSKLISTNGVPLAEDIRYKIYAPKGIKLMQPTSDALAQN